MVAGFSGNSFDFHSVLIIVAQKTFIIHGLFGLLAWTLTIKAAIQNLNIEIRCFTMNLLHPYTELDAFRMSAI